MEPIVSQARKRRKVAESSPSNILLLDQDWSWPRSTLHHSLMVYPKGQHLEYTTGMPLVMCNQGANGLEIANVTGMEIAAATACIVEILVCGQMRTLAEYHTLTAAGVFGFRFSDKMAKDLLPPNIVAVFPWPKLQSTPGSGSQFDARVFPSLFNKTDSVDDEERFVEICMPFLLVPPLSSEDIGKEIKLLTITRSEGELRDAGMTPVPMSRARKKYLRQHFSQQLAETPTWLFARDAACVLASGLEQLAWETITEGLAVEEKPAERQILTGVLRMINVQKNLNGDTPTDVSTCDVVAELHKAVEKGPHAFSQALRDMATLHLFAGDRDDTWINDKMKDYGAEAMKNAPLTQHALKLCEQSLPQLSSLTPENQAGLLWVAFKFMCAVVACVAGTAGEIPIQGQFTMLNNKIDTKYNGNWHVWLTLLGVKGLAVEESGIFDKYIAYVKAGLEWGETRVIVEGVRLLSARLLLHKLEGTAEMKVIMLGSGSQTFMKKYTTALSYIELQQAFDHAELLRLVDNLDDLTNRADHEAPITFYEAVTALDSWIYNQIRLEIYSRDCVGILYFNPELLLTMFYSHKTPMQLRKAVEFWSGLDGIYTCEQNGGINYDGATHSAYFPNASKMPRHNQLIVHNTQFDNFLRDFLQNRIPTFSFPNINLRIYCVASDRYGTALKARDDAAIAEQLRDVGVLGKDITVDRLNSTVDAIYGGRAMLAEDGQLVYDKNNLHSKFTLSHGNMNTQALRIGMASLTAIRTPRNRQKATTATSERLEVLSDEVKCSNCNTVLDGPNTKAIKGIYYTNIRTLESVCGKHSRARGCNTSKEWLRYKNGKLQR